MKKLKNILYEDVWHGCGVRGRHQYWEQGGAHPPHHGRLPSQVLPATVKRGPGWEEGVQVVISAHVGYGGGGVWGGVGCVLTHEGGEVFLSCCGQCSSMDVFCPQQYRLNYPHHWWEVNLRLFKSSEITRAPHIAIFADCSSSMVVLFTLVIQGAWH